MAEYKIYEDEQHHLGLVSLDGKRRTSALYDEIQMNEDGIWYCRAYINWDYFYTSSGTFSVKSRNGSIKGANGNIVSNNGGLTNEADRAVYDSISERKESKFIITYEFGKFGLKSLDGSVIIDAVYDDIDVWEDSNVIQVRKADQYLYFNDKKEQILTDEPGCSENGQPYLDGMGWNNFMVREIVDRVSDNHTYISKAGIVRVNQQEVKDVATMLESNCERIPMNPEAIKMLTDQYSYEFGMTIIKVSANPDGVIEEDQWITCIEKLKTLGDFGNSWHYIDKFVTNSHTKLSTKSLYWLKHRYDMECDVLGNVCFAYGIDESLKDGEVKWIHVEHYNEYFPEDYGVCDEMQYGTLSDLKQLIESHDWKAQGDPYGGCFFGYRNIRYPEERSWKETEKVLDYMYQLGHNPEELIECVVSNLQYNCDSFEEMTFWEKCAEWALDRCTFPNKISSGNTCFDDFLETRLDFKSEEIQHRIKKLEEKFLAHGAKTNKEQSEHNLLQIENLSDPYDYTIVEKWKNE